MCEGVWNICTLYWWYVYAYYIVSFYPVVVTNLWRKPKEAETTTLVLHAFTDKRILDKFHSRGTTRIQPKCGVHDDDDDEITTLKSLALLACNLRWATLNRKI